MWESGRVLDAAIGFSYIYKSNDIYIYSLYSQNNKNLDK